MKEPSRLFALMKAVTKNFSPAPSCKDTGTVMPPSAGLSARMTAVTNDFYGGTDCKSTGVLTLDGACGLALTRTAEKSLTLHPAGQSTCAYTREPNRLSVLTKIVEGSSPRQTILLFTCATPREPSPMSVRTSRAAKALSSPAI